MSTLDTFKLYRNPDGTYQTIAFLKQGMLPNETEQEFIARSLARIKQMFPGFNSLPEFTFTRQQIKDVIGNQKKIKRKLRLSPTGRLEIDQNAKTPHEIYAETKASIRQKLKSGQPLNDSEINFLIGV